MSGILKKSTQKLASKQTQVKKSEGNNSHKQNGLPKTVKFAENLKVIRGYHIDQGNYLHKMARKRRKKIFASLWQMSLKLKSINEKFAPKKQETAKEVQGRVNVAKLPPLLPKLQKPWNNNFKPASKKIVLTPVKLQYIKNKAQEIRKK